MTDLGPFASWPADPAGAALLTDFDGTLAPIVDDAGDAAALPGTPQILARLADRLGVVAVVSGRPAAFLRQRLPSIGPRVRLVGLYGMEQVRGDAVEMAADVVPWVAAVAGVVSAARRVAPHGVHVEDKGASVVLHWRQAPAQAFWCRRRAAQWAAETGLAVQPARMALELRPPVRTDKGSTVLDLAAGATRVAYAGDDIGDVAAFDALDRLHGSGRCQVLRVAVADAETPDELVARADLVLDGPPAFVALLQGLADAMDGG